MRVYGQIRKRYPRLRPAVRGEEIRAIHRRQHRILRPAVVGVRVSVPLRAKRARETRQRLAVTAGLSPSEIHPVYK